MAEEAVVLTHPSGVRITTTGCVVQHDGGDGGVAVQDPGEPYFGELTTRTIWVGHIPTNLVGGAGDAVLNIQANKNISSLFRCFGEVHHSTVRVKPGVQKSWALVTFRTIASAGRAVAEGCTVLGADCEEQELIVQPADVASHLSSSSEAADDTQGYLALLAKTHSRNVGSVPEAPDTLWVGGIPEEMVSGTDSEAEAAIREICERFGTILATTVRRKPGLNKSWALLTFSDPESVELAALSGLAGQGGEGDVELRVQPADIESELHKGTTGYLAHAAHRHEQEVAIARTMIRGWWDKSGLTAALGGGGGKGKGGRRFSIEKKLARFRALSLVQQQQAQPEAQA